VRDTELYRHLLGLVAPWEVDRVELSVADGRVDVWVQHPDRTRFACPDCDMSLPVYDHSAERAWRHLDSCAFATFLHASAPRVACPEHGVRQVRLPWAEPHSRFTMLFERLAIDVLAACDVAAAAGAAADQLGRGMAADGPRRAPRPGRETAGSAGPRRGR